MTHGMRRIVLLAMALMATKLLAAQTPPSDLRLPPLFGDHMVVQRDVTVPVWGWAPPHARVSVKLDGHSASTTADSTGRWRVAFAPLPAGGPHMLTVSGADDRVVVHDIVAGDVWLASGQSNMEFRVDQGANAAREIASAHDSAIRHFKIPISWSERPVDSLAGGAWTPADSQHVGAFSAVAYFFAREVRSSQHVPIGIVNSTWGGSAIETWISARAQGMSEEGPAKAFAAERQRLDSMNAAMHAKLGDIPEHDPGLVEGNAVWAAPTLDETGWRPIQVPGYWESQGYEGMDGVGWYRTTVTLTADEAARGARLVLGAIDDDDITWVNGTEVGRTNAYNALRNYEVPASALHAGSNVIAVRVTDGGGGGGIGGSSVVPHLEIGGMSKALPTSWSFRVGELRFQMDGQRVNKVPAVTYNRMVHPLLPMPIKGVIWYQGESNANDAAQARAYRTQFATLIRSWRHELNGGKGAEFPFLWVQLPNYGRPDSEPPAQSAWALQRESMQAALTLPNTGQAITIDIGEAGDIHPRNKQDVGRRLGLVGRRVAYREPVLASGPVYRSHSIDGSRVTLTFDHLGGGLSTTAPDGTVGGFAVAGTDRRFVWARGRIEGDHVVVSSDRVRQPVAVRYAWANNPADANLYSKSGLPAAPFRTDSW
jgi:sialate O-acetylesterase